MKKQPATPLPYIYRDNGMLILAPNSELPRTRVIAEVTRGHAQLNHPAAEQDGRYLVHAANAYPELVKALRNCVKAQDATAGAKGSSEFAATEGARHMLKQLGEWK